MRIVRLGLVLVAAMVVLGIASACGGGDSAPAPGVIEGGLPDEFPEDLPVYEGLTIVRSSPLGERYVVEANTEDSVDDVISFYEEELGEGRWELIETADIDEPPGKTIRFTAPGWEQDGRLQATRREGERTIVGIAIPLESGGE